VDRRVGIGIETERRYPADILLLILSMVAASPMDVVDARSIASRKLI
jgi:hypothetical protein